MSSQAAIVTVVCIMTCPSSKYDCWSVFLSCHCHRWLPHGQSQLQTRVLVCPLKLSLSQMVTSWPVPAPNTCAGLSPEVVTVTVGYFKASPSFRHVYFSAPLVFTVTVGYIIVSPGPKHVYSSVPLCFHCHIWSHNGQSHLQRRLLVFPLSCVSSYIECLLAGISSSLISTLPVHSPASFSKHLVSFSRAGCVKHRFLCGPAEQSRSPY